MSHRTCVYTCPTLEYELTDDLTFISSGLKRCDFRHAEGVSELSEATTVPQTAASGGGNETCEESLDDACAPSVSDLCEDFLLTHNFSTFQMIENLCIRQGLAIYDPKIHGGLLDFIQKLKLRSINFT